MLPWVLKIVWFALSLSGLLGCWVVLVAFGSAVRCLWAPLLYCIGATILEGVFCLGMIWKMDPFFMPKAFCISQTLLIGFGAFLLTGICTAFSFATNLVVLHPTVFQEHNKGPLCWRMYYLLPMGVFPLLASAAQITIVFKFDAVRPTDDFHCDASKPWVRLLGYAGTPLLLGIPCFFISVVTVVRALKVQKYAKKRAAEGRETTLEPPSNLTDLPQRRSFRRFSNTFQGLPRVNASPFPTSPLFSAMNSISGRAPISPAPGFASPVLSARQFHLPFNATTEAEHTQSGRSSTAPDVDEPESPASTMMPTFARGSNQSTPQPLGHVRESSLDRYDHRTRTQVTPSGIEVYEYEYDDSGRLHPSKAEWRHAEIDGQSLVAKSSSDRLSSVQWERNNTNDHFRDMMRTKSDFDHPPPSPISRYNNGHANMDQESIMDEGFVVVGENDYVVDFNNMVQPRRMSSTPYSMRRRSALTGATNSTSASNLGTAIWRLILFQIAFCLILCLASISTLIDVIVGRTSPTAFGTQHVALILASWGPVIVFGHLPAVRKNIRSVFSGS